MREIGGVLDLLPVFFLKVANEVRINAEVNPSCSRPKPPVSRHLPRWLFSGFVPSEPSVSNGG